MGVHPPRAENAASICNTNSNVVNSKTFFIISLLRPQIPKIKAGLDSARNLIFISVFYHIFSLNPTAKCAESKPAFIFGTLRSRDMKKLLLFVVAFCGFTVLSHNADAKCTLLSCGDTSFLDPNVWITADIGGNQCWFCGPGPNSCSDDEVVPYLDGVGDVIELYQCSSGIIRKFVNYEPGYFCKDSELQSGNGLGGISLSNAKKTYRIDGVTTSSFSLGDLEAFVGRASCIYIKCNYGYMPNSDKTKCIADNREQDCVASGGTWTNSTCTCDVAKNLRVVSGGGVPGCIPASYRKCGIKDE